MRAHYFSEMHPEDQQYIRFGKAADPDDSPILLPDEAKTGVWDEAKGVIYPGGKLDEQHGVIRLGGQKVLPYYGPEQNLTWYAWEALPRLEEEVTELMHSWYCDPSWDIEATKGFEAHHDELLAYRQVVEAEKEKQFLQGMLADKAAELGAPDNTQLARYVLNLEYQLEQLNARLTALEQ